MKHITIAIIACFLTISCSSKNNPQPQTKEVVSYISENPQTPFEVYNAMARALKYNLKSAISENNKKVAMLTEAKKPQQKLAIFVTPKEKQDMYSAYQNLNAAILIAQDNPSAYSKNLAQSLMLAGASAYNKAGFAKNTSLDIKRSIKIQKLELEKINKKETQTNNLSKIDETRKEALELYLLKMDKLQEKLHQDILHFNNLESLNTDHVKFGSKKYFNAKNLKKEFTVEDFENLAQENGVIYNVAQTKNAIAKKFPSASRINMDTQAYKNKTLQDEIIFEALQTSKDLLEQKATINQAKLLQIKLGFYLTKLLELEAIKANQIYITKTKLYNQTKKDRSLKNQELKAKAEMLNAQYNKNNAQGAFVIAIQNLYFITDPISFDNNYLNKAVGLLAKDIKKQISLNTSKLMATDNYKTFQKKPIPAINKAPQWADPSKNWLNDTIKDYKD